VRVYKKIIFNYMKTKFLQHCMLLIVAVLARG